MAVDKNKIIAEATRLVQKGALDKAIKTYERILEEDPKDVRVQLKIAELHQKKGDDARAAEVFRRAAETYAEQGFFLKAVAVFKQVAKLDAADLGVCDRLAGLYQQLGLMSDAAAQLQQMAAGYEKAGDPVRLLEVLRRMVEFDPENVAAVIKIGELHQRANQAGPALEQFRRAAEALKRSGRTDEYLRVAERIASLAPDDLSLTRELANLYLARNDTKRALSKLQICFQAAPKDVDTLELLAKAFQDLGQTTKRVSVFKELARIHEERGRSGDARAVWRRLREIAPDDPDAAAALGPAAPAASPPPAPRAAPAPPLMARVAAPAPPPAAPPAAPLAFRAPSVAPAPSAAPAPPGPDAIPKLLTETDVYLKYGLHEKALDHLRRILAIDPDSPQAHEKIRDVSEASGGHPAAIAAAEEAVRACLAKGLQDRARENLARLQQLDPASARIGELAAAVGATEEIGLEGAEVPDEEVGAEEPEEVDLVPEEVSEEVEEEAAGGEPPAAPAGAPPLELIDDEPLATDDDLALGAAAQPEDERVIDEEAGAGVTHGSLLLPLPEPEPDAEPAAGPPPARAPLPEPTPAVEPAPAPAAEPELEEPPDPFAPPPRPAVIAAPVEVPDAPAPPAAPDEEAEVDLSAELEEVDFFLEQGLLDDARDALGNLRAFYPDHPGVAARLEDLDLRVRASAPPAAPAVPATAPSVAATAPSAPAAPELAAPAPARPELPNPGELDRVHETPALVAGGALEGGSIDLGADLGDLLGEATAAGGAGAAEDFQYSVEDVFNQFKKGVAETVKAEDSETHYDLGIAYKEMGLLDDAVGEFETAIRGANRRKEVDCLSMIGLCRMAQGRPRDAADALRRALRSDYLTRDAAKAIHHDLGAAHEALGEPQAALWYYQKVLKVDPAYRDLSARVAALGGGAGAPPEGEGPAPATPTPAPARAVVDPPAARPAPLAALGGNKKNIGFL